MSYPPFSTADYPVGSRFVIVPFTGAEWPVEVVGRNSLPCDLIVKWLGKRPLSALTPSGKSTICLNQLQEIRELP